jgi:predicted transcriptional regulator
MHQSLRRRLAARTLAVVMLSFGAALLASPALAGHGHGGGQQRQGFRAGGHGGGGGCGGGGGGGGAATCTNVVSLNAAASALGLTAAQLQARVRSGQTLAEIAASAGKSVDTVAQTLTTDAKAGLDAAVAAGTLSTGQAQAVLVGVPQQVATLIGSTLRGLSGRCGLITLDISAAASLLGETVAQLQAQLSAGQTLATISAALGKTAATVAAAASAAVKTGVDAAVAAGSLTPAQGSALASGTAAQITGIVTGALGG